MKRLLEFLRKRYPRVRDESYAAKHPGDFAIVEEGWINPTTPDAAMAQCDAEASYAQRTTDEWSSSFAFHFRNDVDTHIEMMTDLRGGEAYALRRLIMISLRQFCRDKNLCS